MSSSFAALMALSATQTRQSEAAVQSALAERQRKEAQKRKQQEEKEKKEREIQAKLRLKHLEEQKREEERRKRMEEERAKKEAEVKKKQEEEREALRYGPKKYPSSGSTSRKRYNSGSDDESGGGLALTREEKRQQRLQRELNYGQKSSGRSAAGAYRKAGRRLPGGAVDSTAADSSAGLGSFRSARERLAAAPPTLIKLNVNKRDTRTIDEIARDIERQKAGKTLMGDEARSFDDWFGKGAKAKPAGASISRASSIFSGDSRSPSPEPASKQSAKAPRATSKSLSGTPPVQPRPATQPKSSALISTAPSVPKLAVPPPKGTAISVKALGKPSTSSGSSFKATTAKTPAKPLPSFSKQQLSASRPALSQPKSYPTSSAPPRKRNRSPSLSDSPPPPRKRPLSTQQNSISAEIWKMFGKDRNSYVSRDVLSDEEDMEADARDLEKEELYSAKLAKREDEIALEEERRHEEEKRRRKKEREMRERRL